MFDYEGYRGMFGHPDLDPAKSLHRINYRNWWFHVSLNLIIHHHTLDDDPELIDILRNSAFFFLGCSNLLWVTFKATSGVHGSSMVIVALYLPNFHQFTPPTWGVFSQNCICSIIFTYFFFWCLVGYSRLSRDREWDDC